MKKDLIFVGIHEFRRAENFLFPVGELIQIPLSEKTTLRSVYDQLEKHLEGDELGEAACRYYMKLVGSFNPRETFFKAHFFEPEPGIKLFAVYNLKKLI